MLLIYLDEQALSEGERERCYRESTQLAHELSAAGQYLAAAPLEPTAAATSVRVRQGDRKSTRLNSSHSQISYAVFCLKKKKKHRPHVCLDSLAERIVHGRRAA